MATTFTSNALQALQVIGATQHMVIVLDPDGYAGSPEIVYLTGHVSSAATATLLRGQEGTTARAHLQDTPWVHSATTRDFDGVLYRQGGSATDWSSAGTTNRTPSVGKVLEQVGVVAGPSTAATATSSAVVITFPVAYVNVPHATVSVGLVTDGRLNGFIDALTATTLTVKFYNGGTGANTCSLFWRVVGEAA